MYIFRCIYFKYRIFFHPSHHTVLLIALIANVHMTESTVSVTIKRNYKDEGEKYQIKHSADIKTSWMSEQFENRAIMKIF